MKKLYVVEFQANGINWLDNFVVKANSKKEAISKAKKQWNKEHEPLLIGVELE